MAKKYPYPTGWDKNQILKRLPIVKPNLISDLKVMGWKEKWIRHLIWLMKKEGTVYYFHGVLKET